MILGKDINPENNIYYIGSLVIQALKQQNNSKYDFLELFSLIDNNQNKISINSYSMALNWLFILGVIKIEKGSIKKCF